MTFWYERCMQRQHNRLNDVPPYTSNKLKWKRLHWRNLHNNVWFAWWGYSRHDPSLSFTLTCKAHCHRYLLAWLCFTASHDLFFQFSLSSELRTEIKLSCNGCLVCRKWWLSGKQPCFLSWGITAPTVISLLGQYKGKPAGSKVS